MSKETLKASSPKTAGHVHESLAFVERPERLLFSFLQYSRLTSLVKRLSRNIYYHTHNFQYSIDIKSQRYSPE